MAEELQSLLERIRRDGVDKAAEERERMIEEARQAAAATVRQAEEKAAEIRRQAEAAAKLTEDRAHAAIRQGARDILLGLREELQRRLRDVVRGCVGEAMTAELMGQMIVAMQQAYLARHEGGEITLEVLLNARDRERLEALCRGALAKHLQAQPNLLASHEVGAGLKLGSKGDDLFFDFSDEALADLVCAYVGPRLATLLRVEEKPA